MSSLEAGQSRTVHLSLKVGRAAGEVEQIILDDLPVAALVNTLVTSANGGMNKPSGCVRWYFTDA